MQIVHLLSIGICAWLNSTCYVSFALACIVRDTKCTTAPTATLQKCRACFVIADEGSCNCLTLQSRVGGELLLDPTADESYHEDGGVLMAMMPNANLVRSCWKHSTGLCQLVRTRLFAVYASVYFITSAKLRKTCLC